MAVDEAVDVVLRIGVRHAVLSLYATPDEVLLASRDWRRGDYNDPVVFRRRLRRRRA
jgi:hypothetical protein